MPTIPGGSAGGVSLFSVEGSVPQAKARAEKTKPRPQKIKRLFIMFLVVNYVDVGVIVIETDTSLKLSEGYLYIHSFSSYELFRSQAFLTPSALYGYPEDA